MAEWRNVVFSDESRFCFFNESQCIRVGHRPGERSNPAVTVERPTARQRGIMGLPNAVFQQDNARPHTARISQHALRGVQMLPWSAYSPDLSPIEHMWDVIGRRLQTLPLPRTNDQLWQMVERKWRTIPHRTPPALLLTLYLEVFLRASRRFYILLSRCRAHCVT
ncbi:transposable element Tc1 transposase [Trichonephila clavipes]|uniref:Transposable element Tc1 transposase n=1 Tax=Trichonephila clavipes TaxID=2585209 RepID=A0A8X6S2Y3_TRICX|nr:transposable element Tc1 transposase [Trichonephila clavipes]